jgi:hypothetical protein
VEDAAGVVVARRSPWRSSRRQPRRLIRISHPPNGVPRSSDSIHREFRIASRSFLTATGAVLHYDMNNFMGGSGVWQLVGVLAAVFLIIAIVKMVQKK